MKKQKIKLIVLLSIIIIILTTTPYIYGYFNTPQNYYYLGIHLAPSDIFVYQSYINQIKNGHFFLTNLFNNDLPPEHNFNIFWLAVGLLAKIFHLPAIVAIHLVRIILIPVCLYSLYLFLSLFFTDFQEKKIALILLAFSSGLGAILSPIIKPFVYINEKTGYFGWPMDLWVAESNTFLTFYQSPHFIASLTFLILIFYFFLKSIRKNKIKYSFLAGFLALIYFNFHPFYIVNIFSILFVYLIYSFFKNKKLGLKILKHGIIMGIISLPSIIYHLTNILNNPNIKEKALQNICKTTSLPLTFISLGIPLFLAIYGIYYLKKKNKKLTEKYSFIVIWLLVNLIIIYLPFLNFQRRLIEGIQIPIIILATLTIFHFYKKYKNKKPLKNIIKNKDIFVVYLLIILFFLSLSNLYILTEGFLGINQKIPYIKQDTINSFNWLDKNTNKNSTILSSSYLGNILPGFINRHVFIGHWVETTNYQTKEDKTKWFFSHNNNDQEKKEFLKNYRLNYILYSDIEKNLGNFNPEEKKYLKKVYQQNNVKIFKVLLNQSN